MKKSSFILYADAHVQLALLTDQQAGILFKAVMQFAFTGEKPAFQDPVVEIMFSYMSSQIERDQEKFEQTCKRRSENAKKRWSKQKHASTGENENVNENVNENENENMYENVYENVYVYEDESPAPQGSTHDPHTKKQTGAVSVEEIQETARSMGYIWSREEAEKFLAYNRDRNRTGNWKFAIERWEQQRSRHASGMPSGKSSTMTDQETDEMNAYLDAAFRWQYENTDDTEEAAKTG